MKIIIARKLAAEWGSDVDFEGTSINTKFSYSIFKWQFKEFCKTIQNPIRGLPEMVINDTVSGIFSTFCHHCLQKASSAWVNFCSYAASASSDSSILVPDYILRYSYDGFTSSCRVLRVDDVDGVSPCVFIKFKCGRTLFTSSEHFQHPLDPDIASVPSTLDDFRK